YGQQEGLDLTELQIGERYCTDSHKLKVLLAAFEVAHSDYECVAFDSARQPCGIAAAVDLVDLRRVNMEAAVVAHHVVAFLMIALLRVIAHIAGIERRPINAVGAL